MIRCSKKQLADGQGSTNHLVVSTGLELCCGDAASQRYDSAEIDTSGASTVAAVNFTLPGGSAQTVAFDSAIDWTDEANDDAVIEAIDKAVTDQAGCYTSDGGIELDRDLPTADRLVIRILDSDIVFNWIGTATTAETAFTATPVN